MATTTKKPAKPIATAPKKAAVAKKAPKKGVTNHSHDIYGALEQQFGFRNFKGTQEPAINSVLDGRDTFVIMPTGGGKSLCYQLPAMIQPGCAIIVSPLIALMKNQVDLV